MTVERLKKPRSIALGSGLTIENLIHPSWRAFIEFCNDLQHGKIEVLKLQNGLPMLAEVTRKKLKFAPER